MQLALLLGATALACACASSSQAAGHAEAHPMRWLVGEWVADDGQRLTTESWWEVSPQTLEGVSEVRSRATGELRSSESLRLVQMEGEVFFLAKVGHNELPIAFRMTAAPEGGAVFENPGHDFPKKLEYQLAGLDELLVTVSDGAGQGFQLRYRRSAR